MIIRLKTFFYISILLLVCFTLSTIENEFILKDIKFSGNSFFKSGVLRKKMIVKENGVLRTLLFWKRPEYFNEYLVMSDIDELRRLYQKSGFADIEINYTFDIIRDKNLYLTINITENSPYTIREVKYEKILPSVESVTIVEKLLSDYTSKFSLPSGIRFEDVLINKQITALNTLFHNNGFPEAEVKYDLLADTEVAKVDVVFTITTGDFCVFGTTKITGNQKTQESLVLKEVVYSPGEIFDYSQLDNSRESIQQLGLFSVVSVRSKVENRVGNSIPLEIDVQEAPFLQSKFGVGYGIEDHIRISAEIRKLSFLGGTRSLTLNAKHSYLLPYYISLKFTQPQFPSKFSSFSVNPYLYEENEEAYKLLRYGSNVSIHHFFSNKMSSFLNYKLEKNKLKTDVDFNDTDSDLSTYYNKSNISLGIAFDSSDSPLFPEKGAKLSLISTYGGIGFNSKYHYFQTLGEILQYLKLSNSTVLAYKAKLGYMKPLSGDKLTPIEERFFAGGSNSLRGWSRSEISPEDQEGRYIGGDYYAESSVELRQQIWKYIFGAVFYDWGNVWAKEYNFTDLKDSAGLGVRFKTPIGPIRLDAAQPVKDHKKQIQVHLSIGQSF